MGLEPLGPSGGGGGGGGSGLAHSGLPTVGTPISGSISGNLTRVGPPEGDLWIIRVVCGYDSEVFLQFETDDRGAKILSDESSADPEQKWGYIAVTDFYQLELRQATNSYGPPTGVTLDYRGVEVSDHFDANDDLAWIKGGEDGFTDDMTDGRAALGWFTGTGHMDVNGHEVGRDSISPTQVWVIDGESMTVQDGTFFGIEYSL